MMAYANAILMPYVAKNKAATQISSDQTRFKPFFTLPLLLTWKALVIPAKKHGACSSPPARNCGDGRRGRGLAPPRFESACENHKLKML